MYFQGQITSANSPKIAVTFQMADITMPNELDYAKKFFKHIEELLEKDGFMAINVEYRTSF